MHLGEQAGHPGHILGPGDVHDLRKGVEPGEVHLHPRLIHRRGQGLEGVAGAADRPHVPGGPGLAEGVHGGTHLFRPVTVGQAVQQHDVDVVGAQFTAEALDIALDAGGIPGRGLGGDRHPLAGDLAERRPQERVRLIEIRRVPPLHALIQRVAQKAGKSLLAQIALLAPGLGARADGQARRLDARAAQLDQVATPEPRGLSGSGRGRVCRYTTPDRPARSNDRRPDSGEKPASIHVDHRGMVAPNAATGKAMREVWGRLSAARTERGLPDEVRSMKLEVRSQNEFAQPRRDALRRIPIAFPVVRPRRSGALRVGHGANETLPARRGD